MERAQERHDRDRPAQEARVVAGRCPFCHDVVSADAGEWVACAACLARHHEGCWQEAPRCAACGHGERLVGPRGASADPRVRTALVALVAAVLSLLVMGGLALSALRDRLRAAAAAEERALALDTEARFLLEREGRMRALVARDADVVFGAEPPTAWSSRGRSPMDRALALRRVVAAKRARELIGDLSRSDGHEARRLRGAAHALEPLDELRDAPGVSLDRPTFLRLPPGDHPDAQRQRERLLLAVQDALWHEPGSAELWAQLATLRVRGGDAQGALDAANHALDLDPTRWLGWVARGQAALSLRELKSAELDLLIGEALCAEDPTWAILARADLAELQRDWAVAVELGQLAIDLGGVPAEHLALLRERVERLETRRWLDEHARR